MWPFRHNSLFSSKKKSCNPHTPFSFVAHNTIPGRKKQSKRFHQNYFKRTTNKPDIFCHSFKASALSQLHLSPLSHSHTLLHLEAALSATFRGGGEAGLVPQSRAQLWHEAAASAIHSRSFPNVLSGKVTRIKCWLVMSLQTRSCLDYINMSKSCSITLT